MLSLSSLRHILYCLFCICIFVFVNLTYWRIILISLLNNPLFTNIPHFVKCIFKCIFKKRIIQNCIFKNSLLKLLASKDISFRHCIFRKCILFVKNYSQLRLSKLCEFIWWHPSQMSQMICVLFPFSICKNWCIIDKFNSLTSGAIFRKVTLQQINVKNIFIWLSFYHTLYLSIFLHNHNLRPGNFTLESA